LASSNLLSQPVLIGDQFASEAITCTTAGFALATISGIVVARPSEAEQTAKNINNRIEVLIAQAAEGRLVPVVRVGQAVERCPARG
jgi:hypothetical protein